MSLRYTKNERHATVQYVVEETSVGIMAWTEAPGSNIMLFQDACGGLFLSQEDVQQLLPLLETFSRTGGLPGPPVENPDSAPPVGKRQRPCPFCDRPVAYTTTGCVCGAVLMPWTEQVGDEDPFGSTAADHREMMREMSEPAPNATDMDKAQDDGDDCNARGFRERP